MMVSYWVEQQSAEHMEQVASTCDFSALEVKLDYAIGEILVAKHDYFGDMMRYFKADPYHRYQIEAMHGSVDIDTDPRSLVCVLGLPNSRNALIIQDMFSDTLKRYVGQVLIDSDWWTKNDNRIKNSRKNFKKVKLVMES